MTTLVVDAVAVIMRGEDTFALARFSPSERATLHGRDDALYLTATKAYCIIGGAHVVSTPWNIMLKPIPFHSAPNVRGVGVFRYVGIADESLVAIVDETVAVHVAVFEVAHFHCAES